MNVEKGITKTDQPEKKRRINTKTEEEKERLKILRCHVTAIYSAIASIDSGCHCASRFKAWSFRCQAFKKPESLLSNTEPCRSTLLTSRRVRRRIRRHGNNLCPTLHANRPLSGHLCLRKLSSEWGFSCKAQVTSDEVSLVSPPSKHQSLSLTSIFKFASKPRPDTCPYPCESTTSVRCFRAGDFRNVGRSAALFPDSGVADAGSFLVPLLQSFGIGLRRLTTPKRLY